MIWPWQAASYDDCKKVGRRELISARTMLHVWRIRARKGVRMEAIGLGNSTGNSGKADVRFTTLVLVRVLKVTTRHI